jgi:putative transposase
MPIKYTKKSFLSGGMYHIYNRGIDGRRIFGENQDFERYIEEMKKYLDDNKETDNTIFKDERPYRKRHKEEMKLIGGVEILVFCLMPDHLHLLLRQNQTDAITKLMRRVNTGYVMYYNKKYKRHGPLFEGVYKAIPIKTAEDAVYISRMVHLNPVAASTRRFGPVEAVMGASPGEYLYSSCRNYLNREESKWINTSLLMTEFGKLGAGRWKTYGEFVGDNKVTMEQGWRGGALD